MVLDKNEKINIVNQAVQEFAIEGFSGEMPYELLRDLSSDEDFQDTLDKLVSNKLSIKVLDKNDQKLYYQDPASLSDLDIANSLKKTISGFLGDGIKGSELVIDQNGLNDIVLNAVLKTIKEDGDK